jgi:hypothetical protein
MCGFEPKLASLEEDANEPRITKIKRLIKDSCFGIHDLSRMDGIQDGEFPRFNMPFELGLDMGCREYGLDHLREKKCLVLEKERYRYSAALSDLAGSDIRAHDNNPKELVKQVRAWLSSQVDEDIPAGNRIWEDFTLFDAAFHAECLEAGFDEDEMADMHPKEYMKFINNWMGRA